MIGFIIGGSSYPIHEGHKAVIDYAKSFGDVMAIVALDPKTLHYYTNSKVVSSMPIENIHKRVLSLKDAGVAKVKSLYSLQKCIDSKGIVALEDSYNKAIDFMNTYGDILLIDRYKGQVLNAVTSMFLRTYFGPIDSMMPMSVRGPEVISFFLSYFYKELGRIPISIYPNVIKDPTTSLRVQTSSNSLPIAFLDRFPAIVGGIRENLKVGVNERLVIDINNSYHGVPWKVRDIVVYEGGFVPGRLEAMTFDFNFNGQRVLIEDMSYES